MVVKENIEFKRGQDSKKSLSLGDARLQPTIYTNQYTRTFNTPERMAHLEELEERYNLMEVMGYYDVFLIDRNIPVNDVVEIFEKTFADTKPPFEVLGQIVAGMDEDAMGGYQVHVVEINTKDWNDFDIKDLRVLSSDGDEGDIINITEVI